MVALDTLMGTDESIGFEDFLNGMTAIAKIFISNMKLFFLYRDSVTFLQVMYFVKPMFEMMIEIESPKQDGLSSFGPFFRST